MNCYEIDKKVNPLYTNVTTRVRVEVNDNILTPSYKEVEYKFIPMITDYWRRKDWKYEFQVYTVDFKIELKEDEKLDSKYLEQVINSLYVSHLKLKSQIIDLGDTEKKFYKSQIDTFMYHIKSENMKATSYDDIYNSYGHCFNSIEVLDKLTVKAY